MNRPCLGGPYGRARAAPARTRWRTGKQGIPNYSVWRGFPAAGRTLNARRPKTPREDTIQPAPAMITLRKHTRRIAMQAPLRSEEHTSELQSLMRISYAVFCLKKNKKQHTQK